MSQNVISKKVSYLVGAPVSMSYYFFQIAQFIRRICIRWWAQLSFGFQAKSLSVASRSSVSVALLFRRRANQSITMSSRMQTPSWNICCAAPSLPHSTVLCIEEAKRVLTLKLVLCSFVDASLHAVPEICSDCTSLSLSHVGKAISGWLITLCSTCKLPGLVPGEINSFRAEPTAGRGFAIYNGCNSSILHCACELALERVCMRHTP